MRLVKHLLLIVLFWAIYLNGFTQSVKTIDSLEEITQHCRDEGKYMLGCGKHFYFQMGSLLNIVYFKLYSSLNDAQKTLLKKEQRLWLKACDVYFDKTFAKFKENNPDKSPYGSAWGAQDDAMFMYNDNAAFVEKRVIELIKKASR